MVTNIGRKVEQQQQQQQQLLGDRLSPPNVIPQKCTPATEWSPYSLESEQPPSGLRSSVLLYAYCQNLVSWREEKGIVAVFRRLN